MNTRRNVVLLICDQMQQQRLGSTDPFSLTPHLNSLAGEGTSFTRSYCSNAQCTPSRASMQTGLYPHESGVMVIYGFGGHTGHLGASHRTIAHVFQEAGYHTAFFGKSHFGYPIEELGYETSIETGVGPSLSEVDQSITDHAIEFLNGRIDSEPVFLVVSWHQPHPPFEAVEPYHSRIGQEKLPLPESFLSDDLSGKPRFQRERRETTGGGYDERTLRREMAQYYSMISAVDSEVGRVIDALTDNSIWDDSVIAFTADHGDMMGAHGLRLKGPLPYEELFRVPLIIKAPGVPRGESVDTLGVNVQLPGTLIDLAGVRRPDDWPEHPALIGTEAGGRPPEHVFMEHYGAYWGWHPFRMIVSNSRKYVQYYGPDDGEEELYDLVKDPTESTNLAKDPAYADDREYLVQLLETWWRQSDGRDWQYYESDAFRLKGAADLVRDNQLWSEPDPDARSQAHASGR